MGKKNMDKMNWIQWMQKRSSVRTFEHSDIQTETMDELNQAIDDVNQVLSEKAYFKLIQSKSKGEEAQKLGTYGIILGTHNFIAVITTQEEVDALNIGYHIEKIVLFATGLGLGTCWLGGTFDRSSFEDHLSLKNNEKLVILIAFGYKKNKQSMIESTMRILAKSNQRKPSSELFFEVDAEKVLDLSSIGDYEKVLEMVRIAPSASNKQPWRIIKDNDHYHFYLIRTPGYGVMNYDLQLNDMGIAKCHFELATNELGLSGYWEKFDQEKTLKNWEYVFSWVSVSK